MKTDLINISADDITTTSSITINSDYIRIEATPVSITPLRPQSPNCVNCGAPLPGDRLCRYCDTRNH